MGSLLESDWESLDISHNAVEGHKEVLSSVSGVEAPERQYNMYCIGLLELALDWTDFMSLKIGQGAGEMVRHGLNPTSPQQISCRGSTSIT